MSKVRVFLLHAEDEDQTAEDLRACLESAGYPLFVRADVLVGDSIVSEVDAVLREGGPVVVCATRIAAGDASVTRIAQAVRSDYKGVRLFAVQMDKRVNLDALSPFVKAAAYHENPEAAKRELLAALAKHYPETPEGKAALAEKSAEEQYRELTLRYCDIVDLANLPEDDRHLATRDLELRRLYVPLHVRVDIPADRELTEEALEAIEKKRAIAWGDFRSLEETDETEEDTKTRFSLGERLAENKRLVVLGDPGAGKTTLLRWLATTYLLRLKNDDAWREIPDVRSLPDQPLFPILVRCRELDETCRSGNLEDILRFTLRRSEFSEKDVSTILPVLVNKLISGDGLLLIDGLDEITDPQARITFCKQIERIQQRYENAWIVVTSRIVGYREMGTSIRRGFEHVIVDDLFKEEKDAFAKSWCAYTEPADRRERATRELIHSIHSTDRIERLTGNPMLLTTMALVKRKVGVLPRRRHELYREAVVVLLNWRAEVDTPIDRQEALPQLEYLAYAMCDRGIQQITESAILELWAALRREHPNLYSVHQNTPAAFLKLVEGRTGILVEVGRKKGEPVYEFRHLTIQEYLAAGALINKRFPGCDPVRSLAENIAPLAGRVRQIRDQYVKEDYAVVENWRETLRLCLASCSDGDVDNALMAVMTVCNSEEADKTARARAVLAALCLADEPNASDETANAILANLANHINQHDGTGINRTIVDAAVAELATSRWYDTLIRLLTTHFFQASDELYTRVGGLCGFAQEQRVESNNIHLEEWLSACVANLPSDSRDLAASACLGIMQLAFRKKIATSSTSLPNLLSLITLEDRRTTASMWAIFWLLANASGEKLFCIEPIDHTLITCNLDKKARIYAACALGKINDPAAVQPLIGLLKDTEPSVREAATYALGNINDPTAVQPLAQAIRTDTEPSVREAAAKALGKINDPAAVQPLIGLLKDTEPSVREAATYALGNINDPAAVQPLIGLLKDTEPNVRRAAVEALGSIKDPAVVQPLAQAIRTDTEPNVREAAAKALGNINDPTAVQSLLGLLKDTEPDVRKAALGALSKIEADKTDRIILSRDLDGLSPFLDPQVPIRQDWVEKAAREVGLPVEEVKERFRALAVRYGLTLEF